VPQGNLAVSNGHPQCSEQSAVSSLIAICLLHSAY